MPHLESSVLALGTASSIFVSGSIFAFSLGGVSTARLAAEATSSPELASRYWLNVYQKCHYVGTPMVLFSTACFAWLRYQTHRNVFLAAAASCASLIPYTIAILSGPEEILFAALDTRKGERSPEVVEVCKAIVQWGNVNIFRAVFPLVGGLVALAAEML
ncbi:hypothetical protein VB005_07955 [Metarhizium brunneum]